MCCPSAILSRVSPEVILHSNIAGNSKELLFFGQVSRGFANDDEDEFFYSDTRKLNIFLVLQNESWHDRKIHYR